jgi:hypothetical protein
MSKRTFAILASAAAMALAPLAVRAADVSPPVILQYFESQWSTMEKRLPDVFMAGYGALWTPPPGRALYVDQGGGIGYDLYDRFDLGKAGDPTLYGTENGYRSLVKSMQRFGGDVYVDYVDHHVGTFDLPAFTGNPGSPTVQSTRDYPGFELSDPYQNNRDTYSDPPPAPGSGDFNSAYQYQFRLAHLITIDLTNQNNRFFVRNPVPGFGNNIPQAPNAWPIATSVLLPDGKVGADTKNRQANTPTEDNRRFYPDQSLPGMTVTDPGTGGGTYTIRPFNTANPSAGDPTAEDPMGYMMRYAQWLINDIGVDGLRIDAARHVPRGVANDPYNPNGLNVPAMLDRAVYRQNRRTNLDGSTRNVFSFQEVFTADKGFNQTFVRKDINPNTPNVVGGNRDVLDFPLWFAMRSNMTGDGNRNNWFNIRNASQDIQDDGFANNGSQSIGFVINHDDGRGNINDQQNDYIVLDNVAQAWVLTRPGNAYVYFNSHEFDRSNNNTYFLKDGRGDALGGQYGSIITNLLDIRNSYGRGNFLERYIDNAFAAPQDQKSAIYVYERDKSMIVGLNVGYNPGYTERNNVQTNFGANVHLVELSGHYDDNLNASGNAYDGIPQTIVTNGSGQISALRIPWNNAQNNNQGYVMYGLPRPQGTLALSNVSQMIASQQPGNNATGRITPIDVITGNSFNITLNTTKVTLSDGYVDVSAAGDNAIVRIDEGLDLNSNGAVDNITPGQTGYGFENFLTTKSPGYGNPSGNGTYVQSVNTALLPEGYHYITARAYRQRSDGGPEIFSDFKKVIYVDRFAPISVIDSISAYGSGAENRRVQVRSADLTAEKVDVFFDLGAGLTEAQVIALANGGSSGSQVDRDLFSKDFANLSNGTHVVTVLTREITGNYSILRATGLGVGGTLGLGYGDTNASGTISSSDIITFQNVLESSNQQYNAGAEANTDGVINLADAFLLGPRLATLNADVGTVNAYNTMLARPYVTSGTYTVNSNQTVHDVTAGVTDVQSSRTLNAWSIRGGTLNVAAGAVVNISTAANSGKTSQVTTLNVASTGKLNLSDRSIAVGSGDVGIWNGSIYTGLSGQIDAARNDGTWNGNGITTDRPAALSFLTGIGIATAAEALGLAANATTLWNGITVDGGDTLLMYTYVGDANLSGTVNADDYAYIDFYSQIPGAPSYTHGDFNFDGSINADDYALIDSAVQNPGDPFGAFASPVGLTAVPEPGSLGVIAMAMTTLLRRRRRDRTN